MADSNEPEKATAHITVSTEPGSPPSASPESRDIVRIHLPTRAPATAPPASADSSSPARAAVAATPVPMTTPSPKKETARITKLPEPPAATVTVALKPQLRIDQIPMPLCWVLLATSVTILILQIWNYLS